MTTMNALSKQMLAQAKWAFATRRVRREDAVALSDKLAEARSGDLVLGRVESIGSHKRIQLPEGRGSALYVGDLVVLACGDRYASDQFEGVAELNPKGCEMLAGGGVLGRMRHRHAKMSAPTRIIPLGLLIDATGEVVNLQNYALSEVKEVPSANAMTVVCIVGAAMNSGKTTAVASFAHGLSRAGHRVAALKATGTGAFGDFNAYTDAGASYVADFTDVGMVSTYRQPLSRIEAGLESLLVHAAAEGCEVAVVELADGVFQKETAELLRNPKIRDRFAGVVFAAPDALAAAGGCAALRAMEIEPASLTGMVSCSPLGAEEAEAATGVSVVTKGALCDPAQANALLAGMVGSSKSEIGRIELNEVGVAA